MSAAARFLTRTPLLKSRLLWSGSTQGHLARGIVLRQSRFFSSLPPHEVVGLPSLSPTMESGTIAAWNVKEGDSFIAGDVMCSVETDKATVDFEAQDDGFIAKILVDAGPDEIQCGSPILVTVEEGDDVAAFANYTIEDAGGATSAPSAPPAAAAPEPEPESAPPPTPPPSAPTPAAAPSPTTNTGGRVVASPLAHSLAKEMGYDISAIPGTGPGGRIIAADVKEYVPSEAAAQATSSEGQAQPAAATSPGAAPVAPPVQGDGYTDISISEATKLAAGRLAQSKRNVPHYYLTVDITMDNLLKTRKSINATLGEDDQLGVYEFLIKAAACSMKAVPSANACWMDSVVRVYDSVDINVVLGQGDSLVMPVIRDCGGKGISGISGELLKTTATLLENGEEETAPLSLEAGTFSVVNVGMFGVKSCAPIIREPQACALAVGALENRIVPNDDKDSEEMFKESVVMTATLSCDHRVVDGAVGAQWLSAFKSYVEKPSTLLL